jgi:hypothetical protein
MTRKTYRTAQGKTVDLGALMLQNENTRAVGNMKVNARGDLIDGWNRPIDRRTQQVKKQYDRQVTNVRDEPVLDQAPIDTLAAKTKADNSTKTKPEPKIKAVDTVPVLDQPQPRNLADAIAQARTVRQETSVARTETARNRPGVERI